jgi:hypothetical protein
MKRWIAALTLLTLTITVAAMSARTEASVAERALSANRRQSDAAIAELRAAGQPGLDAFVAASATLVNQSSPEEVTRFRGVLDRVCRQRDCYTSHLYWYTDLAQAEAAAHAAGKPILSLRLLGNLDDELSCANSRFFRTTLYANAKVARVLHDQFVLHWSSERPVPKITVDFGDGRKICSTVTGNSAHYLLAADGTPLDVLPGLYSPDAFLAQLAEMHGFAQRYAGARPSSRALVLSQYHQAQFQRVALRRDDELSRIGVIPAVARQNQWNVDGVSVTLAVPEQIVEMKTVAEVKAPTPPPPPVSAAKAAMAAMSKGVVEIKILPDLGQPIQELASSEWKNMAANHVQDVHFDEPSLALMREKAASLDARMLTNLKRTVAEDTLRDELDFHLRIHQWFANSPTPVRFEALNQRIYAELFLTPASDPWLGMLQDEAFSAVAGGGVISGSK